MMIVERERRRELPEKTSRHGQGGLGLQALDSAVPEALPPLLLLHHVFQIEQKNEGERSFMERCIISEVAGSRSLAISL